MKTTILPSDEIHEGLARFSRDVVFATPAGVELHADIISPRHKKESETRRFPAMVFVQGCGWKHPGRDSQIPQLCALALKGIVVMTIEHRNRMDGFHINELIQDVKSAVRYLRANAESLCLDPDRIGIWGTSSGGMLSLVTGLTANDPEYRNEFYNEFSDEVKLVVDCFGPADLIDRFYTKFAKTNATSSLEVFCQTFFGKTGDCTEDFIHVSPYHLIEAGKNYPPMLVLHGDADPTVPYEESVAFCERMDALGYDVEFVSVEGGLHEKTFWSKEVVELIFDFILRKL